MTESAAFNSLYHVLLSTSHKASSTSCRNLTISSSLTKANFLRMDIKSDWRERSTCFHCNRLSSDASDENLVEHRTVRTVNVSLSAAKMTSGGQERSDARCIGPSCR